MLYRYLLGDVRAMLATLPDRSVQMCVTSPPYWGLRSYLPADHPDKDLEIGSEPTMAGYIAHLVGVFQAVKRVLRDDGVLFLNLGDGYFHSSAGGAQGSSGQRASRTFTAVLSGGRRGDTDGLKEKDLCMIPARVAIALQEDGWYLRSAITWCKPSPMPESVTDRPTSATEMIYLLSKSPTYYYDAAAIAEPAVKGDAGAGQRNYRPEAAAGRLAAGQTNEADRATRNARNWWTVASRPFTGAHYAVYPPELILPCVLAGSASRACEQCGAPWQRVVETSYRVHEKWFGEKQGARHSRGSQGQSYREPIGKETTGWEPTCTCSGNTGSASSVVLDPFAGSGTTGMVALSNGRGFIGIDLDVRNKDLAQQRIGPLFQESAS